MTDLNIISRIKKGDRYAYKRLYDRYAQEMYSTSYRITNNKEESKDILQEAFLTSFQKIESLRKPELYRAWLKKIVINQSLMFLRLDHRSISLTHNELEISLPDESVSWYQQVSLEQIKKEVQQLPHGSRTVFTLYAFEGFMHREISELLKISISTSKSQYKYACNTLKNKLLKFKNNEV